MEDFKVEIPAWLREYLKSGRLVCCATCHYYDPETNWCGLFEREVPEDFVSSLDKCPTWEDNIPF